MYSLAGAVPANGVVVLNYTCYFSCESPPDPESFTLTSNTGVLVPGSVILSGTGAAASYLVFRPAEALSAGEVYTAELEGAASLEGVESPVEVTVGPDLTWSDTFTLIDEIFEIDHPAGETVCCTGPLDSCGGTPCFRTEVERRTAVSVRWGDGSTPEDTQYAFRLVRDGAIDLPVPWSWNGASTGFELEATEDADCYVLELQRLADGVIQTFEERCIEQPDTFTPGLHPTPDEDIAGELATCDGPPPGYEDAWCEARNELCEGNTDAWCAGHAELCADTGSGGAGGSGGASGSGGGDTGGTAGATGGSSGSSGAQGGSSGSNTTGGSAGNATGGSSGSSPGTGGTSGTGEGGTPGDGEAGEAGDGSGGERVLTKGCGCSIPGKTSRESLPALAALGLLVFGLRRRVRRPT